MTFKVLRYILHINTGHGAVSISKIRNDKRGKTNGKIFEEKDNIVIRRREKREDSLKRKPIL